MRCDCAFIHRSNAHVRGLFAVGCDDGVTLILSSVDKSKKRVLEVNNSPVCHISNDYYLSQQHVL
jgi:hypothetical protein